MLALVLALVLDRSRIKVPEGTWGTRYMFVFEP